MLCVPPGGLQPQLAEAATKAQPPASMESPSENPAQLQSDTRGHFSLCPQAFLSPYRSIGRDGPQHTSHIGSPVSRKRLGESSKTTTAAEAALTSKKPAWLGSSPAGLQPRLPAHCHAPPCPTPHGSALSSEPPPATSSLETPAPSCPHSSPRPPPPPSPHPLHESRRTPQGPTLLTLCFWLTVAL